MERRKQDENLIPGAHSLTVEEQSMGGKASGEARRKKRSMKSAAKLLLSMGTNDIEAYQRLIELGLEDEDLTNQMVVIAAMLKQAASGNVRAAEFLRDTVGESPSAEIARENAKARRKEIRMETAGQADAQTAAEVEAVIEQIRQKPGMGDTPAD